MPVQKQISDINFQELKNEKNVTFNGAFTGQWAGDISSGAKIEISKLVANTKFDAKCHVDNGADGSVYKIKGISHFPRDIAVKISHSHNKNPQTGEMQRVNSDFQNERVMLTLVRGLSKGSQELIGYLKTINGKNMLLTTFVEGQNPDVNKKPLNKESLKNILILLNKLDEAGILHRDLKEENVLVDSHNNVGLLDYGVAVNFNILDFETNVEFNHFTEFEAPLNIKSFESTLLLPYMSKLMKRDTKAGISVFRDYLKLKSKYIHTPCAQRIQQCISDNAGLSKYKLKKLEEMLDYQMLCAKVQENVPENILNIELLKAQILYNSELAYKNEILLLNPLANAAIKFNALLVCKRHEHSTLEALKKADSTETKNYLQYHLRYSRYYLEKLSFWMEKLTEQMLKCFKTPVNRAQGYEQEIIEQFLKNNLNKFEIPDIWGK